MNKNIWNLYKTSERGKKAIAIFEIEKINMDVHEDKVRSIIDFNNKQLGGLTTENVLWYYFWIFDNIIFEGLLRDENEEPTDYFIRLVENIELNYLKFNEKGLPIKDEKKRTVIKKGDYKKIASLITELSLVLYFIDPFCFYPIMFPERFDQFIKILDALEISIPELPSSADKKGRLLFYETLCDALFNFGYEYELSPAEICACIYDFAPMLIEEDKDNQNKLPEPTNIWLTGGSKKDYEEFLKKPVKSKKSVWTCNENTKRGDIIIMYVRYPHSCIQSIWRADTDGIFTPFNLYNGRTKVTDGILVPPIRLNELKEDPYFSKLPITRKNFQGVNGIRFTANDYEELQKLLEKKGFDTSTLPQLYSPNIKIDKNIKVENDVEEKLLIPLLKKLGFLETDWSRQISQKAGRKEKAIPDFVFFPKGEKHFQNAPMVIEAKYDMYSNLERTKAYNQALSYARMMSSIIFGICDKERLIIFKKRKNGFDRYNPIFEKHWQKINDEEVFRELKLLIGKNIIEKI